MGHIVKAFDKDIARVQTRVEHLMQTCLEWTEKSAGALAQMNSALARDVVADDTPIEGLRREIIGLITIIMVRRQPMALDFRILATARDMALELIHICERAKRIAQTIILLSDSKSGWPLDLGFRPMAEAVAHQVQLIVNAYTKLEIAEATQALAIPKKVKALDGEINRRIEIYVDSHPGTACLGMRLARCSCDLGAISVHSTRVAEAVIFRIEGMVGPKLDLLPDEYIGLGIEKLLAKKDTDEPE